MVEEREMTDWEWRLWSGQTIASQLPEQWETTGFNLKTLIPQCSHCEACLRNENMVRGEVTRLSPDVVMIRMMAFCVDCNTWTPDSIRVKSDKTGNTMLHCNPETRLWEETRFIWKNKFRSLMRWLFHPKKNIKHEVRCSN